MINKLKLWIDQRLDITEQRPTWQLPWVIVELTLLWTLAQIVRAQHLFRRQP